jgi:hypothetical protein
MALHLFRYPIFLRSDGYDLNSVTEDNMLSFLTRYGKPAVGGDHVEWNDATEVLRIMPAGTVVPLPPITYIGAVPRALPPAVPLRMTFPQVSAFGNMNAAASPAVAAFAITVPGSIGTNRVNGTGSPATLARSLVLPAVTIPVSAVASPSTVARALVLPAAEASSSSHGTRSPALFARSMVVPAVTPSAGATKSVSTVARSIVVPAATGSGGGRSTPAAAALTISVPAVTATGGGGVVPDDYTGLTGWWDASQESFNNNDPVGTFTDRSGNSRHLTQSGSARPTFRTGVMPGGGSALDFDGSDDYLAGTNISAFITASTFTVLAIFIAETIDTTGDASTVWANDCIYRDQGGYTGMHLRNQSGTYKVQAYNAGVGEVNEHTISLSTAVIVAMRHGGGNLVSSINGGSETSQSSGNTGDLNSIIEVGRAGFGPNSFFDGKLAELFIYNEARTAGEILDLVDYLETKWT